jgi:hypothetical protein
MDVMQFLLPYIKVGQLTHQETFHLPVSLGVIMVKWKKRSAMMTLWQKVLLGLMKDKHVASQKWAWRQMIIHGGKRRKPSHALNDVEK